jgi:sugar phosphate isomerase/epimerase
MIRLGGPVRADVSDIEAWVAAHREAGYAACYCPLDAGASDEQVRALECAARRSDVVIAEVGAWSNPLAENHEERDTAIQRCQEQLALADRIGARCCVNIAGSRGAKWDGPDPRDLTDDTFDMIVRSVRGIIDAVKPVRTFYTLETMPWMYPDSAESYERLIRAIDRPRFAVHFDAVNLICSPQLYFRNGSVIRDFVHRLGPWIKSCHAKDILLQSNLTTHLDEVRPGAGGLDYRALLESLDGLANDVPLMLEHLPTHADYDQAARFIRSAAHACGVPLHGVD